MVDAHPVQGPVQLLAGPGCGALVALGGQEEPARFALQPWPDTHLRLAVVRGHVQMVHPVGEQEVQRLVRDPLGDLPESRPAEDHPAALVAGAAELCLFDGHETSRRRDPLNLRLQRIAAADQRNRAEAYSPDHTISCGTTGDRLGMGLAAWRGRHEKGTACLTSLTRWPAS